MATAENIKLRMQIPLGINGGTQFSDDRYFPDPPWGEGGASDYPTVTKYWRGTESTITRTVQLNGNETYTLPSANNCSASYEENFWTARSDFQCFKLDCAPKQNVNFLYGHKGPASANTAVQSFQRNVVGISWEFATGDMSWSTGLEPNNVILLYRMKDYWDRFYGVYLIKDSYWAGGTKRYSSGTIWNATQNASRRGKISVNLLNSHADYDLICTSDICFQGIWFEFESKDPVQAQVVAPYKFWNVRLIFQDSDQRYDGHRIVLPRNWRFDEAFDRSKPLRLV